MKLPGAGDAIFFLECEYFVYEILLEEISHVKMQQSPYHGGPDTADDYKENGTGRPVLSSQVHWDTYRQWLLGTGNIHH
jgi:hypothetical protein